MAKDHHEAVYALVVYVMPLAGEVSPAYPWAHRRDPETPAESFPGVVYRHVRKWLTYVLRPLTAPMLTLQHIVIRLQMVLSDVRRQVLSHYRVQGYGEISVLLAVQDLKIATFEIDVFDAQCGYFSGAKGF